MAQVICGFCKEQLEVGKEAKSVVVLCIPENKKLPIRNTDQKLWGSAKTRFDCESADGHVRHVVQTDPPDNAPHEMTR